MAARPNPNRLLVEGDEDKRVIPQFMENFIPWGNTRDTWPVEIESFNGYADLLKPGVIEAELKTPGLKALGVIVDANDDAAKRWRSIRERAGKAFPGLPEDMPSGGLVAVNEDGLRFGSWLMPDNKTKGMLETFLALFLPAGGVPLWEFVKKACTDAKTHGAPYNDAHIDKVRIHCWLAVQDPPGMQLHVAVLSKTLVVGAPNANAFVAWFRTLYQL
jgi:hypothetical protein